MKKTIALFLVLTMCLYLTACEKNTREMDSAEVVVGKWIGTYIWEGSTVSDNGVELNNGDMVSFTMSIFNGGAVEIVRQSILNEYKTTSTGTWEVSEGTLVITCATSNGNVVISWEINEDVTPNVMSINGSNLAFPHTITKEN